MLSILIPVYNYDILNLINDLVLQCKNIDIQYEIIVVDDKSDNFYLQKNKDIKIHKNLKYIELNENFGRSKIRNYLASLANFENLIFMDCDSKVFDQNYIKNYITNIKPNCLIYGGTEYEDEPQNHDFYLRWFYGKKREVKKAEIRNLNPYKHFTTNNFLISKSVFTKIKFNEKINTYGHEDTLFVYEIQKNKIEIIHIDNPLIHLGLVPTLDFIFKTKQGVENLKLILKIFENEKQIFENIKLLKFYNKFQFLKPFVLVNYKIFKTFIFNNLSSKKPKLFLFDFYKLAMMFEN